MPKYSIFVGQQEPAANQYLTDLDSRILDVSYRMLLHQNQGDPDLADDQPVEEHADRREL